MRIPEHTIAKPFGWRTPLAGTAALVLLVLPASLPAAQGKAPTPPVMVAKVAGPQITIENFEFNPATLTVPAGTTVTWTNRDDEPHTVTSATKLFSSAGLDQGGVFAYTFTNPGTYTYFCKFHPHMTGTIIVK